MTCIMPANFDGHHVGGWEKAAVVFDSDGCFDVERLHRLLCARLARSTNPHGHLAPAELSTGTTCDNDSTQQTASDCLQRLHVFKPTSCNQLAATLYNLPNYHNQCAKDTEIAMLAVDSIGAFYWPDRFTVEQLRDEDIPAKDVPHLSPLHSVLQALQQFRLSHAPVTVLTNWGLNPLLMSSGAASPFFKQHLHPFPAPLMRSHDIAPPPGLPAELAALAAEPAALGAHYPPVTHHVTLSPSGAAPLPSGTSLRAAGELEQLRRKDPRAHGEVVARVRTPGSSRVCRFVWRIGPEDISVSEIG